MRIKGYLIATGVVAAIGAAAFVVLDRWPWPRLRVGSRAPSLVGCEWLQGTPIDPRRPDGKIVVVECWATWCGPCIAAMPHLDTLQRRWPDAVRVVGVAVHDERERVARFVTRRGPHIGYAMAFDGDGQVQKWWMRAARQRGIPCSFVVDGQGRIAYVGHPSGLGGVLSELVQGTYDVDAWAELSEHEELWRAFDGSDRGTLQRVGADLTRRMPHQCLGWLALAGAAGDEASRGACVDAAMAAVAARPVQLVWLARGLVRRGFLGDRTDAMLHALERATDAGPTAELYAARVHTLLAAGRAAAAEVVARESVAALRERPFELVLLATTLLEGPEHPAVLAAARAAIDASAGQVVTPHVARVRFDVLQRAAAGGEDLLHAGRMLIAAHAGGATELNSLAWRLLTQAPLDAVTRQLALEAATAMAASDEWERPATLDTLALAKFENGMVAEAIALQERAIAQGGAGDEYAERLARYRAARDTPRPVLPARDGDQR